MLPHGVVISLDPVNLPACFCVVWRSFVHVKVPRASTVAFTLFEELIAFFHHVLERRGKRVVGFRDVHEADSQKLGFVVQARTHLSLHFLSATNRENALCAKGAEGRNQTDTQKHEEKRKRPSLGLFDLVIAVPDSGDGDEGEPQNVGKVSEFFLRLLLEDLDEDRANDYDERNERCEVKHWTLHHHRHKHGLLREAAVQAEHP
mmetsp:Transcript_24209/g.77302  ORF Transcript_24209/g.77302 Transcript_24209/m.77302 type:complete len:204 (-) Transcript_24209:2495-3106(-)